MRDRSDIQIALVDIFDVEGKPMGDSRLPRTRLVGMRFHGDEPMTVTYFWEEPRYLNEERSVYRVRQQVMKYVL